jgi:hypothetical protein
MVEIPMRLDTAGAARYLREKHGIPIEEKTLRNRRAAGNHHGPACRYFGVRPLYDVPELDRWAQEDALQPENPVRRNMRLREAERTRSAGIAEVIPGTEGCSKLSGAPREMSDAFSEGDEANRQRHPADLVVGSTSA